MDTKEKVVNLMSVANRLNAILERENKALESYRPDLITDTVDEKQRLSKAYELLTKSLQQEVETVNDLDEGVKTGLVGALGRLQELTDANARNLKIAIEASRRVLDAVANAARSTMPQNNTYGSTGHVGLTGSKMMAASTPLTVNQTL